MKKLALIIALLTSTLTTQAMDFHSVTNNLIGGASLLALERNINQTQHLNKNICLHPDYAHELSQHTVSQYIVDCNVGISFICLFTNHPCIAAIFATNALYAAHNRNDKIHAAIANIKTKHVHKTIIDSNKETIQWLDDNYPRPQYPLIKE